MSEYPITPIAITRYDTVSQHSELVDGPAAAPYRFNWRAVHGAQLAQDFKLALTKLEGLMYVLWGGQPDYAGQQQWYTREHPRCRWGAEQWWQQPTDVPPPDYFWNYLETAALGGLRDGVLPSVPVRSRSGDPRVQFKRSQHSAYFPLGSVERYCGAPGGTGHQVHDPASTFKPFTPWPDSEDVVIRYVPPGAVTSIEWLAVITSHDLYPMSEVEPGVWEATIPARTQAEHVWWFLLGNFNGQPQLRYDPFIGVDAQGDELEPVRRGAISDPEHIGSSVEQRHVDDAYYFVFYSHYNPYASGLPELLDENAPGTPGNWLRRGSDSYEFGSSENIQPGLINLARFVLDHIGARVQHHPSGRGDPELCCRSLPIVWRWSGANTPDLYRGGGKGGTAGSSPLHNHPAHADAGRSDARKSWRGIEMAWQNAADVPGFFPDNWYYGDTESWLSWEDRLTLDPDPLNPPFEAIIRDYGDRGLRAGDAIDPVFLLEIIDAVDYLISNGLVVQVPIHTAPRTPSSSEVWNTPCGERHEWGWYHNYIDSNFDEQWDYTEVDPEGLCCQSVGPAPDYDCDPYERPSWAECTGSGKCHLGRQRWKSCTDDQTPDPVSANENNRELVSCNVLNQAGVWELYEIYNGHMLGGWIRNVWSPTCPLVSPLCYCPAEGTVSAQYGLSYWLCGPDQAWNGPEGDAFHGNGYTKPRQDLEGNFSSTGPSMGNRFASGSVYACATPGINEPTPDFYTVTGVVDHGNAAAWYSHNLCSAGRFPDYDPPPNIPGLGLWNYDGSSPLYTLTKTPSGPCPAKDNQELNADVGVQDFGGCDPDQVYVRIDLNLQGGIPTLYDYNLNIADPFDDCPCKTWTGPDVCL
jgi:hypothetical protein